MRSARVLAMRAALERAAVLRRWTVRQWLVAIVVGAGAAVVIGVPTGIIHTAFYTRMTPVTWWNYPIWALSASLIGLTVATYLHEPAGTTDAAPRARRTMGATMLSLFAVGCPICNKLVVGLIGVSGALSYWAPMQPVLGMLSLGLLATGLSMRLRGQLSCPSWAAASES